MRPYRALQAFTLIALACCSHAYYLPGTYPQEFTMGQNLQGEGSQDACVRCADGKQSMFLKLLWVLSSVSQDTGCI